MNQKKKKNLLWERKYLGANVPRGAKNETTTTHFHAAITDTDMLHEGEYMD